ncbi:hypothetical protein HYALB_00003167 [Hymenoscyphus albidus]|uniref:Uncharacterized protein n=1 Tax=Hymenoscyphus albidus TaxID=595503 RepID=A0A9N9Q1H7_9HELO|nr:hypothetical protein HYALB_00003167 [Hymenoscyphus albidus]
MGLILKRIQKERKAREESFVKNGKRDEEVFKNGQEIYLYRDGDLTKKYIKGKVVDKITVVDGEKDSLYKIDSSPVNVPSSYLLNAKDGKDLADEKEREKEDDAKMREG